MIKRNHYLKGSYVLMIVIMFIFMLPMITAYMGCIPDGKCVTYDTCGGDYFFSYNNNGAGIDDKDFLNNLGVILQNRPSPGIKNSAGQYYIVPDALTITAPSMENTGVSLGCDTNQKFQVAYNGNTYRQYTECFGSEWINGAFKTFTINNPNGLLSINGIGSGELIWGIINTNYNDGSGADITGYAYQLINWGCRKDTEMLCPDKDGDGDFLRECGYKDLCDTNSNGIVDTGECSANDCNDWDATTHSKVTETCDGLDNDCDGIADDSAICPAGSLCTSGTCIPSCTYYPSCEATKCIGGQLKKKQTECMGNCVTGDDDSLYTTDGGGIDFDKDGWDAGCGDCNDNDNMINPGMTESTPLCGDKKDNDCDGLIDSYDPDCPPCELNNAWWSSSSTGFPNIDRQEVSDGEEVYMILEGVHCIGRNVYLDLWEEDFSLIPDQNIPSADEPVPSINSFQENTNSLTSIHWNAVYDLGVESGVPEYYFWGRLLDKNNLVTGMKKKSDYIKVLPPPVCTVSEGTEITCNDGIDNDCDGISDCMDSACYTDSYCTAFVCGNGIIQPLGGEECDDGNIINGDGCNTACKDEFCGDNILQTLREQCDDGNFVNTDSCNQNCLLINLPTVCGDGIIEPGEACDGDASIPIDIDCTDFDSFTSGTISCGSDCNLDVSKCKGSIGICPDGIINAGETCEPGPPLLLGAVTSCSDVPGFAGGTIGCTENCDLDTSGCTTISDGCIDLYTAVTPPIIGETANPAVDYSYSVTQNTVLCDKHYEIPDPGKNGIITIAADGITLDCNNADIVGMRYEPAEGTAIISSGHSNVIIKKCNLTNYEVGIKLENSPSNEITLNIINTTHDLVMGSGSISNNIHLNHFYQGGVNDAVAAGSNSYCVNGEGNFYVDKITDTAIIPANDCGPGEFTDPLPLNIYSDPNTEITLSWSRQSSMFNPVTYHVEKSIDDTFTWSKIQDTIGLSYTWKPLIAEDYTIRVKPYDGYLNGTPSMMLQIMVGTFVTLNGVISCDRDDPDTLITGANIKVTGTDVSAVSDNNGYYTLENVPIGPQEIIVKYPGHTWGKKTLDVNDNTKLQSIDFNTICPIELDCKSDCTLTGQNICMAQCYGFEEGGKICDLEPSCIGHTKGFRFLDPQDSSQEIVCCSSKREQVDNEIARIAVDAENIAALTSIVTMEDKLVQMVVVSWD